ncbi:MAG: carboxypeptidase-like regulatory domain-containing protein, partial [Candidatus Acidiferrales bacterium]
MNSCRFVTGAVRSCSCVFFLTVFAAIVAFGQAGRGSISGTVTDQSGAVISGAKVTLLNEATGVTQKTVTSAAGLYSFISLNPGSYKVTAAQTGFSSGAVEKITVNVDQVSQANIALKVGTATETVTVNGETELVEPTNATVGTLVTAETIDRIPLLYRNVYDLVQLSAGVTPPNGS